MPPVTILSPYTGRSVVVREQDLGRAIRDDQGKVFYVVEDPEHGRYASMTRKGSAKDFERYRDLQTSAAPTLKGNSAGSLAPAAVSAEQAHDATGNKRRNPAGIFALIAALILIAGGVYVVIAHPEWVGLEDDSTTPPESTPDAAPNLTPRPDTSSEERAVPSIVVPAVFLSIQADESDSYGFDWLSIEAYPISEGPQTGDQPTQETPTEEPADQGDTSENAEASEPKVSSEPATLPATPEAYADRLSEVEPDAESLREDPTPVILPTRTWRPGERQAVLSESPPKPYADFNHTASGLRYKVTHRTEGPPARAGNFVQIRYTAQTLKGESLIDDASQSFVLMTGQAIRAFEEGLAGRREGEQLKLFVPRGHSEGGTLPGLNRVPDQPFMLDVQIVKVRPGVTHVVEQKGDPDARPAMPGDLVTIHYIAQVEGRDEIIDTTHARGEPMKLTLGKQQVIPGLELGLAGMRPGETRLLTIPPYLAYGEKGVAGGLIPPNAVLSFRVSLVGIQTPQVQAPEQP